jgi:hypothetical protein
MIKIVKDTIIIPEIIKFLEQKRLKQEWFDLRKCVERRITKRNIGLINAPFFISYVARVLGTVDMGKIICSLDKTLLTAGLNSV